MQPDSEIKRCLNCNSQVLSKFCPECGQSVHTHRYKLGRVLVEDFFLNLVYYKKGLGFTLMKLFTKPGHTVREFVQGKRAGIVHPITLLIIVIILFTLIENNSTFHLTSLSQDSKEFYSFYEKIIKEYPKLYYIGLIPFYALFSFVLFRQANQNYAEHLVLNTFKTSGFLIISLLFLTLALIIQNIHTLKVVHSITAILNVLYGTWFYYQYFYPFYRKRFLLAIRSMLCILIPVLLLALIIDWVIEFNFFQ